MTPTTIADISLSIESWAPKETAQSYDNVGLLVGNPQAVVTACLVSLDLTNKVLDEAIQKNCQLVVCHHPIIFKPLASITSQTYVGNLVRKAIKSNVGLYAGHTNVDASRGGVSFKFGEQLGLENLDFLVDLSETDVSASNFDSSSFGMGCIGTLPEPMDQVDFLDYAKENLKLQSLRFSGASKNSKISRVAVCGGSGSDLIPAAKKKGADVYLTADITYHRYFEVYDPNGNDELLLVDVGHHESERETEALFVDKLKNSHSSVQFIRTSINTNPVRYH